MIFFSAAKVQQLFKKLQWPFEFTDSELAAWNTIDLADCPFDGVAFPTPSVNNGLNLLNLRRLSGVDPAHQPAFFDHPWYLNEAFGHTDCPPGWHILSPAVLPGSISQPVNYLSRAGDSRLVLPSAIEVVLLLFLQYAATGEQFLLKKHTWCSDVASLGRCVTVGAFGRNGVFISGHPGSFYSLGLGICAKYLVNP